MGKTREVKFRSWDIKPLECKSKMIYGIDNIKDFYEGVELVDELLNPEEAGIPEIKIMQFTGLKDKNGKEIFEGDIVNVKSTQLIDTQKVVEWVGSGFNIVEDDIQYIPDSMGGQERSYENLYVFEVIGNKFENPELSEGGKKENDRKI